MDYGTLPDNLVSGSMFHWWCGGLFLTCRSSSRTHRGGNDAIQWNRTCHVMVKSFPQNLNSSRAATRRGNLTVGLAGHNCPLNDSRTSLTYCLRPLSWNRSLEFGPEIDEKHYWEPRLDQHAEAVKEKGADGKGGPSLDSDMDLTHKKQVEIWSWIVSRLREFHVYNVRARSPPSSFISFSSAHSRAEASSSFTTRTTRVHLTPQTPGRLQNDSLPQNEVPPTAAAAATSTCDSSMRRDAKKYSRN